MIQTSEQINEIAGAMAKAQAEIENVERSGANPAFKREGTSSRYATLGGALDEVRKKFASQGIAILQMPVNGEGSNIGVATRFAHSSGQWIESTLFVAPAKFDAQGAGSAITYLRRYALMAMAGIAPEDDDGNAAVAQPQPQRAGMVRAADVPHTPAKNGLNKAALPPSPEETPEITAARQRVRMLIDKLDSMIRTAPNDHVLTVGMDDALDEFKEIEAAGAKGKEAADALRAKYNNAMARFREKAA